MFNGTCQKGSLRCDSVKTQWEAPILSIKQLLINGEQHDGLRMQWNRLRFCHIHYCLAKMPTVASFVPHYMTLVIAESTLQELPTMGKPSKKTHAGYTCVPKSGPEFDVHFCYTPFNFQYGISSSINFNANHSIRLPILFLNKYFYNFTFN
jgi:hypothetical protein